MHLVGKISAFICLMLVSATTIFAQPEPTVLKIPERPNLALGGTELAEGIAELSLEEREHAIIREVLSGNVPPFSRNLKPLSFQVSLQGKTYEIVIYVSCDYLAIGSCKDYLYIPVTPGTAQYLADSLHCLLPTKELVDVIYNQAEIKLRPQPIPPSDTMTTVPVFVQHSDSVKQQIFHLQLERSADKLLAGHKKDIILSKKIHDPSKDSERVVIYGWHQSEGHPIQPVYNGHVYWYADYSHGVRFISEEVQINGKSMKLHNVLKDPLLSLLLSSEGALLSLYHPKK